MTSTNYADTFIAVAEDTPATAGRVALYGMETRDSRRFAAGEATTDDGEPLKLTKAMRSAR